MPSPTEGRSRIPYSLRFGVSAALLIAATLLLVLVVLPRRYVLSSGFRESGVTFPTTVPPFQPAEVVRRAAPVLPPPPGEAEPPGSPGPAERLWMRVTPMLEAGRPAQALPLFEQYLTQFPGDTDVLREYGVALLRAGRPERATEVLEELLSRRDDDATRLLLARTLRDLDRREEAGELYRALWARAGDPEVALEWSRMWSWEERYEPAMAVLEQAIARRPDEASLQVEMARLLYFTDRLERAEEFLGSLDPGTLARLDALELRENVRAALTVPEPEVPAPTLRERAAAARFEGDLDRAAELFRQALRERPDDPGIWAAWADLLEYDLEDFETARTALLNVAELRDGTDAALQYRIAQLEIWTGMNEDAEDRLERLGARLGRDPSLERTDSVQVTLPDVQALLGDLDRWADRRGAAELHYTTALSLRPGHPRASGGLAELRALRDRIIEEVERPGFRLDGSTLADTDDFTRVDLSGGWVDVRGVWTWKVEAGSRWLEGIDLAGARADLRGVRGSLDVARWWRWGTLRTGLSVGMDDVGPGSANPLFGGSVLIVPSDGGRVELRYAHGPAYPLTTTLQTAVAEYGSDEVVFAATLPLEPCLALTAELGAAWLGADGLEEASSTTRLSAAATLTRSLRPNLGVGLELRGLRFTRAAPVLGGRALFWDPELAVSLLPFVRLNHPIGPGWTARGRVAGGAAWLDERRSDGTSWAPQFAADTGIEYLGDGLGGSLDLFYLQGRFEDYRSWGLRLRLSKSLSGGWKESP